MRIMFRRGQSLTEIALILGIVGLVFIGMEIYIKRGLQGKVKDLSDSMIGKEQAVYQQDISGLEVNRSQTSLTSGSTVRSTESPGGKKVVTTSEHTTTTYTSESQDSLAK